MSFRTLYRRAMDPSLALAQRYGSLRRAGSHYAWVTQTSFTSVFAELERHHGLRVGATNEAAVITAAAEALAGARAGFLTHLRAVEARRRTSKRSARRRREPCFANELLAGVVLGQPRLRPAPATAQAPTPAAPPAGLPAPAFELGASVEVRLNERNRTARRGSIRQRIWHDKLRCWTYTLTVDGRKHSKRYLEADLGPPHRAD